MRRISKILLILFCFILIIDINNSVYCQEITSNSKTKSITKSTKSINKNIELKKMSYDSNKENLDLQFSAHCTSITDYYIKNTKIVIDFVNCINRISFNKLLIKMNNIIDVRTSQYKNSPKISRIVIDTSTKLPYSISNIGNQVIISFTNSDYTEDAQSNTKKITNKINNKNNSHSSNNSSMITYAKGINGVIHIPSMDYLNDYSYDAKNNIFIFQVNRKYDISNILKINDIFIKSVMVTNADTFSTIILSLNTKMNAYVATSSSGVNITVSSGAGNNQIDNSSRVIVLDPGHGGLEPGASGNGIVEKNLNLDIALRVKKILEEKKIKVYMTRSTDSYMSNSKGYSGELKARAQYANSIKPDFLISIHTNSSGAAASNGVEVEYYPVSGKNIKPKTLQKGKVTSPQLAAYLEDEIIKATGAKRRVNVSRPHLILLNSTNVVPVLIEIGFLSNKTEAAKLKTEEYKNKLANGIANGIFKTYDNN